MQLRTIIVDDEPLAHEVIKEHAKDVPFISIVGQCYSGTEALNFVNENSIDLIFLDIQMPKLKGLDFLKILKKSPIVIITSAY
ncbi:Transcriptional regulatory protein YehT [compost metagenome]